MRTGLPVRRCRQRLANAFRLDFDVAHSRFEFQQAELRFAELLAAGTVLLDPLQPQPLFQDLDFQMGPGQFLFELNDALGFG